MNLIVFVSSMFFQDVVFNGSSQLPIPWFAIVDVLILTNPKEKSHRMVRHPPVEIGRIKH